MRRSDRFCRCERKRSNLATGCHCEEAVLADEAISKYGTVVLKLPPAVARLLRRYAASQ